jgi:hypothetical protein
MMISVDKMLISGYVPEDGDNRRAARMANISTMFLEQWGSGKRAIGSLYLRKLIREKLSLNSLEGEAKSGDHRAHGDAYGGQGLNLDTTTIGNRKYILFSLPNIVRCSRFLLGGECRPTGALCQTRINLTSDLLGDESVQDLEDLDDNELIDLLVECKDLSSWEANFANSLDKKWRKDGLSPGQRSKTIQIIEERYIG